MSETTEAPKGMLLFVYRPAGGDCTNGGVTSRVTKVIVTHVQDERSEPVLVPDSMRIFPPTGEAPAMKLVIRTIFKRTCLHLEPVGRPPAGHLGWMAGGNCASTSDSRWIQLAGGTDYVSIHDRSETQALYDTLSR